MLLVIQIVACIFAFKKGHKWTPWALGLGFLAAMMIGAVTQVNGEVPDAVAGVFMIWDVCFAILLAVLALGKEKIPA